MSQLKKTTFKIDPEDWEALTHHCNERLQVKERVLRNELLKMDVEKATAPDTSHLIGSTQVVRLNENELNALKRLRESNGVSNSDVFRAAVYRLIGEEVDNQ